MCIIIVTAKRFPPTYHGRQLHYEAVLPTILSHNNFYSAVAESVGMIQFSMLPITASRKKKDVEKILITGIFCLFVQYGRSHK